MKDIPVLHARGKTLAQAYENALIELYKNGGRMSTQYDKEGDPQSIDATMNITIDEPLTDPIIHKAFPGGFSDLREYAYEMDGLKDSWTKNINDPKDTRWEYTYHQRLANYGQWKIKTSNTDRAFSPDETVTLCPFPAPINQINYVVNKLVKQPFTRQAQMITWMPNLDLECYDPPCLQSMWFRITEEPGILPTDVKNTKYLNTNIRFRSNDAWGAYFMNSFGFTMFIKDNIMDKIIEKTGWNLKMGRMNWQADSWHVYGKDIRQLEERLIDRLDKTAFDERVYNFYDPDIQEMYHEGEKDILAKIDEMNKRYANN